MCIPAIGFSLWLIQRSAVNSSQGSTLLFLSWKKLNHSFLYRIIHTLINKFLLKETWHRCCCPCWYQMDENHGWLMTKTSLFSSNSIDIFRLNDSPWLLQNFLTFLLDQRSHGLWFLVLPILYMKNSTIFKSWLSSARRWGVLRDESSLSKSAPYWTSFSAMACLLLLAAMWSGVWRAEWHNKNNKKLKTFFQYFA